MNHARARANAYVRHAMTAQAWSYPPSAWLPIANGKEGERALSPRAEMVQLYEYPREAKAKPKRSKVDLRKPKPIGGEGGLADLVTAGAFQGNIGNIRTGGAKGALNRRKAAESRLLGALAANPELRTMGQRTLVTGNLVYTGHAPKFLARCACGAETLVNANSWVTRSAGRACEACARKQRGKVL